MFGGLGFCTSHSKKKSVVIALGCALIFGVAFLVACGTGGGDPKGGTPAGEYTITVTGSSGATQHSTTVSVTVQ
jgi:hypothetical protein